MAKPRPIIREFANLMESRMRVGDQRGWVWDEDEAATFDFDNLIIRAVSNLMEARTAFGNGEVYLRNISLVDAANLAMLAWNNAYASGLKDACGSRSRLGEEPMTLTDDELKHLRGMGGACEDYADNRVGFPTIERRIADACISELLAKAAFITLAERLRAFSAALAAISVPSPVEAPSTDAETDS